MCGRGAAKARRLTMSLPSLPSPREREGLALGSSLRKEQAQREGRLGVDAGEGALGISSLSQGEREGPKPSGLGGRGGKVFQDRLL